MSDLFGDKNLKPGGPMWLKKIYLFILVFAIAGLAHGVSQTQLLYNLGPQVALLVKEKYYDPTRIKPDAMLASMLQSLENNISPLVVTLPEKLQKELDSKKRKKSIFDSPEFSSNNISNNLSNNAPKNKNLAPNNNTSPIQIDLAGVKKNFVFDSSKSSYWGTFFTFRNIVDFVEKEIKQKKKADSFDWAKIESSVINASLSTLDPHTIQIEPKYARDLQLTTKGEFGGIGIVISIRDNFLTVMSPIDGTPASRVGVKAKDRIIKIGSQSAINMDLNEAVSLLRGKPGTQIKITLLRPATNKEYAVTITREIIKVDSVKKTLLDGNIGYVKIIAFQGNTAQDVKQAILDLKKQAKNKLKGLIISLEDNPGGLLRSAVEISSFFLDGGEIVSTRGARKDSKQIEEASPGQIDKNLPIVVIINGGSASASEIVTGALQERDRAAVVGSASFGKGSVQMLFKLMDYQKALEKKKKKTQPDGDAVVTPAALKLTIAQYFAPGDRTIQTIGVEPDIYLNEVYAEKEDELRIYPNESSRKERDLPSHLEAADTKHQRRSLVNLSYLAPKQEEDDGRYSGKLDIKKLKQQAPVSLATKLIKSLRGSDVSRQALLANYKKVSQEFEKQEEKKIITALKKHGIDWTKGATKAPENSLTVSLKAIPITKSGQDLQVRVKAKNISKTALYRVVATSNSDTDLFKSRELIFGKINPGQEIEKIYKFKIPEDVVSRKDFMRLSFTNQDKKELASLDVPLVINGLKRPRLAHMVYVDDSKSNNADGLVQTKEDVELVVWIKNIGEGDAFEPTVLVRNKSGNKVFLKKGREKLDKALKPGESTTMRLSFRVNKPTDKAEFELQIFDGKMHDFWRELLVIPIKKSRVGKKLDKLVKITGSNVKLFSNPEVNSHEIALLKPNLVVKSLKQIDNKYLVKIQDNLVGFVDKNNLEFSNIKKLTEKKSLGAFFDISYDRTPPKVELLFGDNSGWTTNKTGQVKIKISEGKNISELLLFVNNKKVLYRSLDNKQGMINFSHEVNLKPGVNQLSALAKEDDLYAQRANLTIFLDESGKIISLARPTPKAPKSSSSALRSPERP